jgi:hypothetical protein
MTWLRKNNYQPAVRDDVFGRQPPQMPVELDKARRMQSDARLMPQRLSYLIPYFSKKSLSVPQTAL